jgi:hypothetical protein
MLSRRTSKATFSDSSLAFFMASLSVLASIVFCPRVIRPPEPMGMSRYFGIDFSKIGKPFINFTTCSISHQERWGRRMLKQDVEYIQDLSTQLAQIAKSRNLSVLAFLLEMAALESSSICDQLKKRSSRAAAL